jgi:hypothetical protein
LPNNLTGLYRVCRAFDEAERKAVDFVLAQFFELRNDGYHNSRANRQLLRQAEVHERQSKGGRETTRKRWGDSSSPSSLAISYASGIPKPKPEEKTSAAKTAPSDPRYASFFKGSYEAFKELHLQPPTWGGRDGKKLRDFLRQHPNIAQPEWEVRYGRFLRSTSRYFKEQHGSLGFFVDNFDKFIEEPIPERNSANAKQTSADQRTRENLDAAGLLQ